MLAWKLRGREAWAALWIVVTLLPVLRIAWVVNPLAERNLYLASVGFIWLVARALSLLNKRAAVAVTGAILVAYSVLTIVRLPDWRDDLPLFEKALQIDPSNHAVRIAMAAEMGRRKRYDDGLVLMDAIIREQPNNSQAPWPTALSCSFSCCRRQPMKWRGTAARRS